MTTLLVVIGVFTLIASVFVGLMSGSGFGLILAIIGGITSSAIFFALSMILSNQEKILFRLEYHATKAKKQLPQTTCAKCSRDYDSDMTSCSHCGFKPQ